MDTAVRKLAQHPMPDIAAFVAKLKEAFGCDVVDEAIQRGKAGEPVFFGCENGRSAGTASPTAHNVWKVDDALYDRRFCPGCDGTCVGTGRRCHLP
ncbi:hypothetical protein [Burkholderia pseudomallei]|uniref:hypothetical protein n=1 Tax=Burkholderia pseudomallei TaxID=28450 RepID=UPI0005E3F20F|nr:hypothetical protein [Burkholderia pseudomallei]CAJ3337426.1 Uncharacterised protein [Burkholderia pseudomallei]CAJ3864518.1 Uncharacterised protein [Burkholderia pseudomallei]CAJ3894767.1 Uncharacterised protein [Burkholderia pseudomallei]CAJ5634692.1 Uncharacterised protein [Burkholderia pseudomallei]CAJ6999949.1 Uncharacterised protein [Burkholderia pseudomallei]